MRILMIMPDAHMHKLRIGPHVRSMREAPLTMTTLAALTPADGDIEITLIDESIDRVPLGYPADLVAISAITGCAPRAYALADHFRSRGIPVVLGGVHVSILPGEAKQHADAVVVGMAERSWPRLIADFRQGRLAPVYADVYPDDGWLTGVPLPRRDLQRMSGYMAPNTIQATRGCKRVCDFCSVPVMWPKYLRRPVGEVIRDIQAVQGSVVVFNDVSLVDDVEYAKELFTAMIPLKKRWGGLATTEVVKDEEMLDLMQRSGCVYLLLGFESVNQSTLFQIRKGFNKSDNYQEVMETLHGRGISVQGCFVFGFDHDDASVFASTVERVNELKIDIPRYSIYTPYPGTTLFKRLLEENRIVSFNWEDYDTMHVVIQPALMSPEELYDGFKWAYKETFRVGSALRRVTGLGLRPNAVVNYIGNLCYRIFVKRLYHEPRYATPYSINDPKSLPDAGLWADAFLKEVSCPG
ncbi:MAG: B12-binding domain-containing radical SAM protein [Armatimonadota bacterium]